MRCVILREKDHLQSPMPPTWIGPSLLVDTWSGTTARTHQSGSRLPEDQGVGAKTLSFKNQTLAALPCPATGCIKTGASQDVDIFEKPAFPFPEPANGDFMNKLWPTVELNSPLSVELLPTLAAFLILLTKSRGPHLPFSFNCYTLGVTKFRFSMFACVPFRVPTGVGTRDTTVTTVALRSSLHHNGPVNLVPSGRTHTNTTLCL